jgi:hypothetical protein
MACFVEELQMARKGYLFFVSYARANTAHPADSALLQRFVTEIMSDVAQNEGVQRLLQDFDLAFFDRSDIEVGTTWTEELRYGLETSLVALSIYSPNYFTSSWCGKEFQVFWERRLQAQQGAPPARTPIVPVWWIKSQPPTCAATIQYEDGELPQDYRELGLRQVMRLDRRADYYQTLAVLVKRLSAAAVAATLPQAPLNLENIASAWEVESRAKPHSHSSGSISKTCFVYVARDGWHWQPYPETREKIGAIAQTISGQLGLQYEEILCDTNLPQKLQQANQHKVPAVLFGDPASLPVKPFDAVMAVYDTQFLLNCGMIVPWAQDPLTANDPSWHAISKHVLPQKTAAPPPHHEWRSIFSAEDLKTKTLATIENIRLRLLPALLSEDSNAPVRKAENAQLTASAASQGIDIGSTPQLQTTTGVVT